MSFLPTLEEEEDKEEERRKRKRRKNLLLLLFLLLLLLLTFIFPNLQICFTWGSLDSWSVLFFWCFLVVYENLFGYVCLYGYVVGNLFLVMYIWICWTLLNYVVGFDEICCWTCCWICWICMHVYLCLKPCLINWIQIKTGMYSLFVVR